MAGIALANKLSLKGRQALKNWWLHCDASSCAGCKGATALWRDRCSSVVSLVAGGLDVGVCIDAATVVSGGAGKRVTVGLKRSLRDQERRELRWLSALLGRGWRHLPYL